MARYQPTSNTYNLGTSNSATPFSWPLGSSLGNGQYNFMIVIYFDPSGIARVATANNANEIASVMEIDLKQHMEQSFRRPESFYSRRWKSCGNTNCSNERRGTGLPAMKRLKFNVGAFSLVEVTLALGVAAFCLLAVFGLVPVGVQTNRNATSQTAAANIMAAVVGDLRSTPKANTTSAQFGITFGTNTTLIL